MVSNRKTAIIVGVLFIIGTVAGILSVILTGSILSDSEYLVKISESENQIILGSLFVLLMGFSLTMIPVMMYPIFKKQNEALALGAIVFRGALEAVMYTIFAIGLLLLLVLSREYINAEATDTSYFQTLGNLLLNGIALTGFMTSFVFCIGALMIYYLFYTTKLIPRWLSVWGLIGAVIYIAQPLLAMFGYEYDVLFVPLAIQEMIFALWVIIKGFNSSAISTLFGKDNSD